MGAIAVSPVLGGGRSILRLLRRVRSFLPKGRSLPQNVWERRHRVILVVLCVHVVGIPAFSFGRGNGLAHSILEAIPLLIGTLAAGTHLLNRRTRALAATLTLLSSSAILVHLSGGVIEAHFHFFITLSVIALYNDWVCFLVAVGYVVVHHGVIGALWPEEVFNHPAAATSPIKWAALHGAFVLGASLTSLIAWRLAEEARARSDLILHSAGDGIYGLDANGKMTFINAAGARLVGRAASELVGQELHQVLHLADSDGAPLSFAECPVCTGEAAGGEGVLQYLKRSDGTVFPIEYTSTRIEEGGGSSGVVVTFKDVTERQRTSALLSGEAEVLEMVAQGALLKSTLERIADVVEQHVTGSAVAVMLLDEASGTLKVAAAPTLTKNYADFIDGLPIGPRFGPVGMAVSTGRASIVSDIALEEYWKDGKGLALECGYKASWCLPIANKSKGKVFGALALYLRETRSPDEETLHLLERFVDLAAIAIERKSLETQLTEQAFHDPLTGLANRALFRDRLEHLLARSTRHTEPVSILFVDLDSFKAINDGFGHDAGDKLLVEVAHRIVQCVRPSDTVARLGGDEFAVLLEDTAELEKAAIVAKRIAKVLETPIAVGEAEFTITASIGIDTCESGKPSDSDRILRNADVAMYAAKSRGRARFEVFETEMYTTARDRAAMESDLKGALLTKQLSLVFQPIVLLGDGRISAVETLLRWDHPRRGVVPPLDFIPVAEETGLIHPIGRWVLEEACKQARIWQLRFPTVPPLAISVNLSGRQLLDTDIPDVVASALKQADLPPSSLILEITESVLMQGMKAAEKLEEIKKLGVRLALDDFGTGYSSLSYLQTFQVDILKVDRSFIGGLTNGPEDSALPRAVIKLGHTLGLEVIAEGVEFSDQVDHLVDLRCAFGQGYLFAKPMVADELSHLLNKNLRMSSVA